MARIYPFRFAAVVLHVLAALSISPALAQDVIEVDASKVLQTFERNPLGININHLMDEDSKRASGSRPLPEALKAMGVSSLRFPEGELGDAYLWAAPPYPAKSADRPQWALVGPRFWPAKDPRFSTPDFQPKPNIMSFDGFLELVKAASAEPIIIVAYDSAYKKIGEGDVRPTLEELITSAAAWVHYANITKGSKIRYWEIGNETDIFPEAHGGADPGAEQYAKDVVAYARAMKAVDPSIKIGINFWKNQRLKELLAFPALWPHVDYLSLHNYPTYGWKEGYETFRTGRHNFAQSIQDAHSLIEQSSLAPSDRARIEFLITETSVIDWANTDNWPNVADHGHALVMFDIIGQTLLQPRVTHVQQWVTRWVDNDKTDQPLRVFDSLTPDNQLTPMGHALALWGQNIGQQLVSATGTDLVHAYASVTPKSDRLTVFLLNKDVLPKQVELALHHLNNPQLESVRHLSAPSAEALHSSLTESKVSEVSLESIQLPPLSISVFCFSSKASQ